MFSTCCCIMLIPSVVITIVSLCVPIRAFIDQAFPIQGSNNSSKRMRFSDQTNKTTNTQTQLFSDDNYSANMNVLT